MIGFFKNHPRNRRVISTDLVMNTMADHRVMSTALRVEVQQRELQPARAPQPAGRPTDQLAQVDDSETAEKLPVRQAAQPSETQRKTDCTQTMNCTARRR